MAASFQQRVRQRKFIYLAVIFVLFSLSLVHRGYLRPLARSYQLTEETRGEVELTSSALRLVLTGSRGIVVTVLWHRATEIQEKHEWEELNLVVGMITKLQPFFITPWLFQSWNLAFNVSVECDRPRDKYYYISQGLELLAEGERRNRGLGSDDLGADASKLRFAGNPDLRHFMGQIYQLKFGTSDERTYMRCLLELSCIDPLHRNPDKLRAAAPGGGITIGPREFEILCRDYPRLIRRIRDLNDPRKRRANVTPKEVLDFLTDNFQVPSRYEIPAGVLEPRQSLVKPWHKQFPLLPDPRERDRDWPDSQAETDEQFLKNEWVDVFVVARTWYSYAQKPLPPPMDALEGKPFEQLKHRLPKQMSSVIFRGTPARAQEYIAETLQSEGWFGGEGWPASAAFPRGSFPPAALDDRLEFRPGKDDFRYRADRAWQKAYEFYRDFGLQNGLYYLPDDLIELERAAKSFEDEHLKSGQYPQEAFEEGAGLRNPGMSAMMKLRWRALYLQTTGFEPHFAACEAERDPLTVAARRRFYEANRLRLIGESQALALYEEAWPLWLQVMLQYPVFAQAMQEEAYEWQIRHLETLQSQQEVLLKSLTMSMGMSQLAVFAHPDFRVLVKEAEKRSVFPIRSARGLLDWVQYLPHPQAGKLKGALLEWTGAAAMGHGAGWLPLLPHPGHANLLLARQAWFGDPLPPRWTNLTDAGAVEPVRQRLRWTTLRIPDGQPPRPVAPP